MSNHPVKACKDGNGSSGTSLHSPQSFWMSRWRQAPSSQGSLVAPHSQTFSREEALDHTRKHLRTNLSISSDIPMSYGVMRNNNTKAETAKLDIGSLTVRTQNVGKEGSDYAPFCLLGDSKIRKYSWSRTPSSTHIFSAHERADPNPDKITVFKSHFSNSDFTSLNQGSGRCEKYSAIMQIDCQADAPSQAMRICTAVDSAGKSLGRPPLYSKTTTHHVLFSRRAGVAHDSIQHRGVKIQPLWSSTDSEKDNFDDAETPMCERSFDLSAETDTMDVIALPNKNNFSGMLFPPIPKSITMTDKTHLTAKLPVIEIPGTNSMDSVEPSPSRTQSLEAEHLLSCADQLSESKMIPHIDEDECSLQEPDCSRSVKRLKLSSSHVFLNMIMEDRKESPDRSLTDKHESKEAAIPSQNAVPLLNGESSSRRKKNPIFESSWIQRWCQDRSVGQDRNPSKSVVICEPLSSKLALDELDKKQFPSIAAVAMMGKSVDGFHGCKFTRRGPLVVWNSEEY